MRRFVFLAIALALGACAPKQQAAAPAPKTCAQEGKPVANTMCDLAADGRVLRVKFGAALQGDSGIVSVAVLSKDGVVAQTLTEKGVSDYFYPTVSDVDQDGRTDILIPRAAGTANLVQAFWRQAPNGAFVRLGEISGVNVTKTVDGYLAVPARDGAADWSVNFYRIDETTLTPIATLDVSANKVSEEGKVLHSECKLSASPGIEALQLRPAAVEAKFCAEPAAKVFDR